MDCVLHNGVSATAYCQSCGKALCAACVRQGAAGQILCEPCWTAWQSTQRPFVPPPAGGPSPGLAALLGAIPGVGAMYNGQFLKGLVHVAIFAALVSAANLYDVFGIFIAAWVFYQMFEAYHTAKARRDGDPLPDPLGLNDLGHWFATGGRPAQPPPTRADSAAAAPASQPQADGQGAGAQQTPNQTSYQSPYQAPYQGSYQAPYAPPPPTGAAGPSFPPIPPVPPLCCQGREPIGAIVLIGLGVLFLLAQFNWLSWRFMHYFWPLLLIGLGVWLIARRLQESTQGEPPRGPRGNGQGGPR